jgi:peptidoglycan biosynthesis protein MviN/MurJ (putative lipid II flippase)
VVREGTKFSLVPLFIDHREALKPESYERFVSSIVNLALGVGIIVMILLETFSPWMVIVLAPGLSPEAKAEATLLLRTCAPMVIFSPGIAVLSVLLNSQKRFTMVALRNAVAPGLVVAAIVLAWNQNQIALWVSVAYALGFAGFFMTVFLDAQSTGYRHQWSAWISKQDSLRLWQAASLPTFGFILEQLSSLARRQVFPSLVAGGGVATFYFASRLVSAGQSLLGVTIATTSLPSMTEDERAGNKSRLSNALRKNLKRVLFVTSPAVILIMGFHKQIVHGLYGRGSFGEASIQQTSQVFFWLGLSLIFSCIIPVLNVGLYAQKAYQLAFYRMVFSAFLSIVLVWLLWSQGLVGIAMGGTLSAALSVLLIIYLLHLTGVSLLLPNRNNI